MSSPVADDDQIIYQWNGASYKQIQRFRADFRPAEIQLPTNYRCPASIVAAANQLVVNNTQRDDVEETARSWQDHAPLPGRTAHPFDALFVR